jgi:exodeoxyribonuclease VII large subunit
VRDIVTVTGRRFPCAKIYIYPSLVQGASAEDELIKALDYFNASHLTDVIIIGRGGGSIEDLWAFNSEKLARKIFESDIPVISAVGHETDFTICDFVADLRAATPSAAAEIAVPDMRELVLMIDSSYERISNALRMKVERYQEKLDIIREMQIFKDPGKALDKKQEDVFALRERINEAISRKIEYAGNKLAVQASKADALSPLSTLARGYSFASIGERAITGVDAVSTGDSISVRVHDGKLECTVIDKKKYGIERK